MGGKARSNDRPSGLLCAKHRPRRHFDGVHGGVTRVNVGRASAYLGTILLIVLVLLAANPTSKTLPHTEAASTSQPSDPAAAPDVWSPVVGATVGALIPVATGTGMLLFASQSKDESVAVTLGVLGVPLLASGSIGAGIGAAIGTGDYHPLDVGVAAACGGLVGTVIGVGGGFAIWSAAFPNDPLGFALPVAGAFIFEPAGAAIAAGLMVGAVE